RPLLARKTDRSCPTPPATAACVCGSILEMSNTARHYSCSRRRGPTEFRRRRSGPDRSCRANSRQEKRRSCRGHHACTAKMSSQVSEKNGARHGWLAKGLSNISELDSTLHSNPLDTRYRSEK